MTPITLKGVRKEFATTIAVDSIDLQVAPGALFFLLGPSGCGKTTLLRILAGLIEPDAGTIHFGDKEVTHVPANKRNCGMVFQGYALWPHMTVAQNVAFGLSIRKVPRAQLKERVAEALKLVQMSELADRKPNELSGGQQQRVALARALVVKPTVLLLDEPLSNLDAKLRLEMRSQIRQICKQAGTTGVYVTHDQKEALSMADEVALMKDGAVVQVGAARQLYERPTSRFVADFLGETNFIQAEVIGRDGGDVLLQCAAGRLRSNVFPAHLPTTGKVTCSVRPEAIKLVSGDDFPSNEENFFKSRRTELIYLGEIAQHQLDLGHDLSLQAFELNPGLSQGANGDVFVKFDREDVVVLQD
jgi:iron(III) transport system ATP-binding protein